MNTENSTQGASAEPRTPPLSVEVAVEVIRLLEEASATEHILLPDLFQEFTETPPGPYRTYFVWLCARALSLLKGAIAAPNPATAARTIYMLETRGTLDPSRWSADSGSARDFLVNCEPEEWARVVRMVEAPGEREDLAAMSAKLQEANTAMVIYEGIIREAMMVLEKFKKVPVATTPFPTDPRGGLGFSVRCPVCHAAPGFKCDIPTSIGLCAHHTARRDLEAAAGPVGEEKGQGQAGFMGPDFGRSIGRDMVSVLLILLFIAACAGAGLAYVVPWVYHHLKIEWTAPADSSPGGQP